MSFSFLIVNSTLSHFQKVIDHLGKGLIFINNQISNSVKTQIELGETWLLGIITGLVLIFLILSTLSRIRPYILCSFWFLSLILLYGWRSGYAFLLIPSLAFSNLADIFIFVLQSIPLIIFLVITKVITVLQANEYVVFAKIFSGSIWLTIAYLGLIIFLGIFNPSFIIANLKTVQIIFWVIMCIEGVLFFNWLIFSSRKNYKFIQFQSTFGLLFLVSLVGKLYANTTSFPSNYLKPKYLLWGIAAQLIFIYWLFLKELFQNEENEGSLLHNNINRKASQIPLNTRAESNPLSILSPRERDVFLAYCNGFSYTEISSSYFISPNTVKTHIKNCYRKLAINSKVEAIGLVNEINSFEK